MKYIDSEIFEYKNGVNVERCGFAEFKRIVLVVFIVLGAPLLHEWESLFSRIYMDFNLEFNCESFIESEVNRLDYGIVKDCHNYFYGLCLVIVFFITLIILYVYTSRGVKFRLDKKRRVIYTLVNWKVLIYRIPLNVDDFHFETIISVKKLLPVIDMINISNGRKHPQSFGVIGVDAYKQESMIQHVIKMYFCEANQTSDDQWIKDTIKRSNDLKHSILFNIFVKPLYFSLFKETSLDDPKLLAKIDAYLEKNPPNPAKDDLYKDFDFYNQK